MISPRDSTIWHNSKCRVLVFSHSVLSKFFSTAKVDPLSLTPPTAAENFKGTSSSRREEILNEIKTNPAQFVNRALRSTDYPAKDISEDVIDLSFTKTISGPAGQFSMTLVPRSDYLDELNPDDLLILELDNGSGETTAKGLVSICLIDRISQQRRAQANFAVSEHIAVYGRDLGKVLLETSTSVDTSGLFLVELTRRFAEQGSALQGSNNKLGFFGSPSEIVADLFLTYSQVKLKPKIRVPSENDKGFDLVETLQGVRPLQQFVFPGNAGVNLAQLIDTTDSAQGGFIFPTIGGLAEIPMPKSGGTLWHLMDQYANRLVNEMFVDVREERDLENINTNSLKLVSKKEYTEDVNYTFALVVRQCPFDKDAWDSLPVNFVEDHEALEFEVGKSSNNIRNVFQTWLFNHSIPSLADQRWPLLIALESVARHGLKHYIAESQYPWPTSVPGAVNSSADTKNLKDSAAKASAFDVATKYLELISTWNAANEDFVEGTLVLRLRPRIRIGERVVFSTHDGNVYQFYVEAVTHSFRYPGASTTTLTLTRGITKRVHGKTLSLSVDRLKLGAIGNIGPTFIGYDSITGQARVISDFKKFQTEQAPSTAPLRIPPETQDRKARMDSIAAFCKKYGEPGANELSITANVLFGVAGVESSWGKAVVNNTTTASGIMQIVKATAADFGTTTQELLDSDEVSVRTGSAILQNYRNSIRSLYPSATINYVLAAYNRGIGRALAYINLVILGKQPDSGPNTKLPDDEKLLFQLALGPSYANSAIAYGKSIYPKHAMA